MLTIKMQIMKPSICRGTNWGCSVFISPLLLKWFVFFKWMGLGLPKRTQKITKEKGWKNHPPHSQKKHITTRWKRGGLDGWSDWFSCSSAADPSGGHDNVKEREGRRQRKERKLRNREKERIKNKTLPYSSSCQASPLLLLRSVFI